MRKALSALGIAVSAAVPLAIPSSLEALMLVPCLRQVEIREHIEFYPKASFDLTFYPGTQAVTAKKGDTLWEISQREYGTPWAYGAIAIINRIRNPNQIKAGQELVLPTAGERYLTWGKHGMDTICPATEPTFSSEVTPLYLSGKELEKYHEERMNHPGAPDSKEFSRYLVGTIEKSIGNLNKVR